MTGTTPSPGTDLYGSPPYLDEEAPRPTWRAVYTIAERNNGRKHWVRIGVAFVNRDQSLSVRLDAFPINGQLHIREIAPREAPLGPRDFDDRSRDDLRGEFGTC